MRLIDADILGEIKSPVKEDVGDYDVRAFRKGWNMAIDTIMENAPTEPVIDKVLEIIDKTIRAASLSGINRNLTVLGTLIEVRDKVSADNTYGIT